MQIPSCIFNAICIGANELDVLRNVYIFALFTGLLFVQKKHFWNWCICAVGGVCVPFFAANNHF